MENNYQRENSTSNAHVGREFEAIAYNVLSSKGIAVSKNYKISIGIGKNKKPHSFDFGADNPKIIVECKSHKWTKGNNIPSAKLTVWNEAMYYFAIAPSKYRKIFFILRDLRNSSQETLAKYYIRVNYHMIPDDVEIWEYNNLDKKVTILKKYSQTMAAYQSSHDKYSKLYKKLTT